METGKPERDAKLAQLCDLITDRHPHEKMVIFTQFADTVCYLTEQLQARSIERVAAVTGDTENSTRIAWSEQQEVGRWTSYQLKVSAQQPAQGEPPTGEGKIVAYIRERGSITNLECRTLLSVEEHQAYYLLKKLCDAGRLKPVGIGKGR